MKIKHLFLTAMLLVFLALPGMSQGLGKAGITTPVEHEKKNIGEALLFAQEIGVSKGHDFSLLLRANLLRWISLTPDLGLELRYKHNYAFVVNGSWTTWSWSNKERRHALREIAPELRYYIGKMCHGYVGTVYKAGAFNYKYSKFGKQGNILGGGITGGYTLSLSNSLNLDFSLGLGYLHAHYDLYNVIDGVRARQGKEEKDWWGPISAGVILTWKML